MEPRLPRHKYSGKMSEVSVVEPLGVFKLDPASNHGGFNKVNTLQGSPQSLSYF